MTLGSHQERLHLSFSAEEKTKTRLEISVHPSLRRVLDAIPKTSVFVLTNTRGRPWTSVIFRASWQAERSPRRKRVAET